MDPFFEVTTEKSPEKKKKVKTKDPIWVDNDEVKAELEAMGGFSPKTYKIPEVSVIDLTADSLPEAPKPEKTPKLKRAWKTEVSKNPTKKARAKELIHSSISPEQLDLVNLVRSQAVTVEEKYRILDAKDKLIRLKLKKSIKLKSSATVGTCPDMCPEKERLMRETQHQVALYEQGENNRIMNPNKAVKQYSRSSADQEAPLPHELRPVSVLQMTMGYLMHNIMDMCDTNEVNLAEWFHFLWDRTRGIRKDITQQELCCQGAVELVEQCARFHIHCSARLVAEDPSVFDQKINTENLTKCLQTLKYMYHDLQIKGERCANEAEFRAYIILLNLSDGNFMWEVQELRQEIHKSKEIKFALQVYSALDKNNYVKFFKLVYSTTYLNACILMRYFTQVRVAAVKTLIKCYSPRTFRTTYPLSELNQLLAFDNIESTTEFMQTYGISLNDENTHILLEKNTFALPEFPYVLDRSLTVVESKRTYSVGRIVCGKDLPPKYYDQHVPQNSFDQKGYLILRDILEESDLAAAKLKLAADVGQDSDSLGMETDSQSTFPKAVLASEDLFAKKDQSGLNIFAQKPVVKPKDTGFGNIFGQVAKIQTTQKESVFAKSVQEATRNVFGGVYPKKSIFSKESSSSILPIPIEPKVPPPPQDQTDFWSASKPQQQDQTDSAIIPRTAPNIFAQPNPQSSESFFAKATTHVTSIFGGTTSTTIEIPRIISPVRPKKGGFTFDLPKTAKEIKAPSIYGATAAELAPQPFNTLVNPLPASSITMPITPEETKKPVLPQLPVPDKTKELEEMRKNKEKEKQKLREIEEKRKVEELERRRLEALKAKKEEEERLRKLKKIKQEEALRKKMEELRQEDERIRNLEIQETVKSVLDTMVVEVDERICQEKMKKIRDKIQKRSTFKIVKRWRQVIQKNKRKRKAMDCSPVWVNTKTLKQSAKELHTSSQDLTLTLMKRYKYGKPLNLGILAEDKISKINLFQLTSSILNKTFFEFKGTVQKNIFWKVVISVPDEQELINGLNRIEETLEDAIQWTDRNGETVFIEQVKPNPMESFTYCVEKQKGLNVRNSDANGIIFIAKDFNSLLQRRIFENLKNFGVFTKVPIVIILQNYDESECKLKPLIDEKIVSNYVILIESLTPQNLVNLVEEGLVFLASKVESPPPLQLDTLNSFMSKYLCTEIWKRANSFAKWNSSYKSCLRNPNIVISLYNEGLWKLKRVILNKSCFEYAAFPQIFQVYLGSEIPDFLPCNYYYFPKFWKHPEYTASLEKIVKGLTLPRWQEEWPPSNQLDLEVQFSRYCAKVFKNPVKPFYKAMSIFLQKVDPSINFENISKVLWTDIIELLGLEKLEEANLSLNGTVFENKSIFNQFIVVYDIETLENYNKSDWFYINNPLVKKHCNKKNILEQVQSNVGDVTVTNIDLSLSIDKTISEVTNQLLNKKNNLQMQKELAEFNDLMKDLETSIKIHKKISSKFEENLKQAIEDY